MNTEEKIIAPEWVINNNQIHEVKFCGEFLETHDLKCVNGSFYDIDGFIEESVIRSEITRMILPYYASGISTKVKNLVEALKLVTHSEARPPRTDEIHTNNGILLTNGRFIPEKVFCRNRLNIDFDPDIYNSVYYPEKFLSFLYELLEPEDVVTLQEYLGYCLIPSTKGQTALFIIGNGGEGKSRIGVVLKEIFGKSMITANFHRIETDKFFPRNLIDKLILVDDDTQLDALKSTGMVKTIITAETPIEVEEKGKQSFQANIYTRLLCFGNGSPKALYDKSDGFARRLIILTTKPKPPNRIDDPFICDKFIAEKEKIFCWMFDGLKRLIGNHYHFTISEKTKENSKNAVSSNCNVVEFLEDSEAVRYGNDFSVTTNDFYCHYERWCYSNGLNPLKKDSFTGIVRSNESKLNIRYDNHVVDERQKKVRGFKGVKIINKDW